MKKYLKIVRMNKLWTKHYAIYSIYVTNAPPKRKVASGDFSFYFFTLHSSLFTFHYSLFTFHSSLLHSSLLSPPPLSFAFLTMFRSQNVVKFFLILCMDIDLSVVLKKRIIRKITIMPGINSGLWYYQLIFQAFSHMSLDKKRQVGYNYIAQ